MAERARVFLTEGDRLRPHKKARPSKGHPWRSEPIKTRLYNPVHVGGSDDDTLQHDATMATGCYVIRNHT